MGGPDAVAALNSLPTSAAVLQVFAPIGAPKLRIDAEDFSTDVVATTDAAEAVAEPSLSGHIWNALPSFDRGEPSTDPFGAQARRAAFEVALRELPAPPADAMNRRYWCACVVAVGDAHGLQDRAIESAVRSVFGVELCDALSARGKLPLPYDSLGKPAELEARKGAEAREEARIAEEKAAKEAAELANRKVPVDPAKYWRLVAPARGRRERILEDLGDRYVAGPRESRVYLFVSPGYAAPEGYPWLPADVEVLATGAELANAAPVSLDLINLATANRTVDTGPVPDPLDYGSSRGRAVIAFARDFLADRKDLVRSVHHLEGLLCQILARGFCLRAEVAAELLTRAKTEMFAPPKAPAFVRAQPPGGKLTIADRLDAMAEIALGRQHPSPPGLEPLYHDFETKIEGEGEGEKKKRVEVTRPVSDADMVKITGWTLPGMNARDLLEMCRGASAGHGQVLLSPGEMVPALTPSLLERAKVKVLGGKYSALLKQVLAEEEEVTTADVADLLRGRGVIPNRELSPQEKADIATSLEALNFVSTRKHTEAGRTRVYTRAAQ